MQELLAAIDAAGASRISFNPLTKPNIDKALQQISVEVGLRLPAESLISIAEGANGDLRNAVETLQLAAAGVPLDTQGGKNQKAKVMMMFTKRAFLPCPNVIVLCMAKGCIPSHS